MISYYKIRIDTNDRNAIRMLLDRYFDKYLVGFESQEAHPHCHILSHTTQKQATIRNAIRKQFGGGNGSYSMKALDEEYPLEYMAYCMKEKDIESSGIPEEKLEEARSHDLKVKKEMIEKKKSRKTILQEIEDEYFATVKDGIDESKDEFVTKERVVDAVLGYYRDKGVLIRQFMIVSLCQTLCLRHVKSYDYEFKRKILENL